MFHNEFVLLEIRYALLHDVVDRFVIVESTGTHTGRPRRPVLSDYLLSRPEMRRKCTVVVVDDAPETTDPWVRETHQRNAINRGLGGARRKDIILVSDADEIPSPEAILAVQACFEDPKTDLVALRQLFAYFRFNMVTNTTWFGPVAMRHDCDLSPQEVRSRREGSGRITHVIRSGGWHFSYLGDQSKFEEKLASFSHQEAMVQQAKSLKVADLVARRADPFGRDIKWRVIDPGWLFPEYLLQQIRRYPHLIAGRKRAREALRERMVRWFWPSR